MLDPVVDIEGNLSLNRFLLQIRGVRLPESAFGEVLVGLYLSLLFGYPSLPFPRVSF